MDNVFLDKFNQKLEVGNLVLFPVTTNIKEGVITLLTIDTYVNIKCNDTVHSRKPNEIINLTKLHQNHSSLFI